MVRLRTDNFSFPGHRTDGLLHKTKSFHRRAWAQNFPKKNKKYQKKNRLSVLGWKTWPRLSVTTLRTRQRKWCWICLNHILPRFFLPRSVKRQQACWRIFCCWKMSDRSYFASWLDPFQTGGIASLLLLTLWQICADTLFKIYFVRRYGRKLPLLLSCLGMSLTYAGYGVLVTIDPAHKWVTLSKFERPCVPQAAILLLHAPLTGHLLGRSILCLLPGNFNRMLRFWSKSVGVSK